MLEASEPWEAAVLSGTVTAGLQGAAVAETWGGTDPRPLRWGEAQAEEKTLAERKAVSAEVERSLERSEAGRQQSQVGYQVEVLMTKRAEQQRREAAAETPAQLGGESGDPKKRKGGKSAGRAEVEQKT